jgi:hypothetical protein
VRRELPEATQRFAKIDAAVRAVLADMAAARNCVACCNREGLLKHLEAQQGELELCEKALQVGGARGGLGGLGCMHVGMEPAARPSLASSFKSHSTTHPHMPTRLPAILPAWPLPLPACLQDYLETKRMAFPRFYFVAPADLLDILSKGSNPQAIVRWVGDWVGG